METNHYDITVKVAPRYLYVAVNGIKTFTIRKADRPYAVGKILRAYIPGFNDIFCDFRITYLLKADDFPDGIKKGYCILGISPISPAEHRRAVMLACSTILKINTRLNFLINEKEYIFAAGKTYRKDWARIWYEKARQIHDLTSGKGEENENV